LRALRGSAVVLSFPPPRAQHRIPYGSDPCQFGDLWLPQPPGPHPVVAFIHGGFWRSRYGLEHAGFLCQALARSGLAAWSIEYRRLGDPDGGWPGTFLDVAQAIGHLRALAPQYALDLERLLLMGHSAGGHLALWVAGAGRLSPGDPLHVAQPSSLSLRAVVALAGVSDLRRAWELGLSQGVVEELLGGRPEQVPERYAAASPQELLPLGVPQILVHGSAPGTQHPLSRGSHGVGRPGHLHPAAGHGPL